MTITPKLRSHITAGDGADRIKEVAVEEGMTTLKAAAARYVLDGTTSIAEMVHATYEAEAAE